MAITAYTGVPGAGKSYALIEQVIVPAVMKGRRVLTNIAGVNPDKVHDYCAAKVDPDKLGEVILFDGAKALLLGFFPTEEKPDTDTFVKGGDLIVFDEWRLTIPRRGKVPNPDLEPFLRFHRHLVNAAGVTCDLAIGTQLITDIHADFRGLVERSYKFRKLKAVGLPKVFAWDAYEGSTQGKGEAYATGNGKYNKEIFALYKSYDTDGEGKELSTDKRTSLYSTSVMVAGGAFLLCIIGGTWGMMNFFSPDVPEVPPPDLAVPGGAPGAVPGAPPGSFTPRQSAFRIVGHILGDEGVRIILADNEGTTRIVGPNGFLFDGDRPVRGVVDGQEVFAVDRIIVQSEVPLQL
jgi:zona occludens toxin